MIDFAQLAGVNIQKLGEDEADQWCERIFKFTPTPDESTSHLVSLFDFTRSLLRLKTIQTDVLIEELQTVGTRLDAVNSELDHLKSSPSTEQRSPPANEDILADLQEQLEAKYDQLNELQAKNRHLEEVTKTKDRELSSVRLQLEASQLELREVRSGKKSSSVALEQNSGTLSSTVSSTEHLEDHTRQLAEKNAQIEQLLDRLYDTDRINLDLAEQVAKLRLEVAKLGNEHKISLSQVEMLTVQVAEFRRLNESLSLDRDRKEKEIATIRAELEHRSSALLGPRMEHFSDTSTESGIDVSTNFFHELSTEIKRQQALLEAKESEISELRAAVSQLSATEQSVLEQKRDEVERLEAELAIISSSPSSTPTPENAHESLLVRQLRRRVRKLRKEKLSLLERLSELEKEAGSKDEHLETVRRRTVALMSDSGDHGASLKSILEENAVLRRMIVFRDDKIRYLIDQLNRHHLASFANGDAHGLSNGLTESSKDSKSEIPVMDQLIAITVERDVLTKQLDAVQSHMASVQKENLELQLGMKEILDGLKAGDTTADLVIECPSLERLCLLLENRLIYPALGYADDSSTVDLSKVILLKSELDFVRGQNEQLRTELKTLRGDFLAVIDEYTNDILENWTVPQSSSVSDQPESSHTQTGSESQNTDNSQTLESLEPSSSFEDSKSDLLQAYYQQLKRFQLKPTTGKRKPVLKKRKLRKRPHSFSHKDVPKTDFSSQTEFESQSLSVDHSKSPKHIPTSSVSVQTESSTPVSDTPLAMPQHESVLSKSEIKKLIIENTSLGDSLLADPAIQDFLLSNNTFIKQVIEANAEVKRSLIQDPQIVDALLKDSRVQRVLQEERETQKSEKIETNETDEDEYVEMFDVASQTVKLRVDSTATQTELDYSTVKPSVEKSSHHQSCANCSKYHQMLTSIRGLIEKERRQTKFQETKLGEQIESLKNNLKLVTTEYHLDLEARTEEIRDLRMKLRKSSERRSDEVKSSDHINTLPKNTFSANLDLSKLIETYPSFIEIEATEKNRVFKIENETKSKAAKSILETIISCLQNCLKQKDEALAEYRQLLESMRQNARTATSTTISIPSTSSGAASGTTERRPSSTPPNELETLYQELFLKPCSAQNEELLSLLSKTFAELNSLRASSKSQQEHLQSQIDTAKSSNSLAQQTITTLQQNISKLTSERKTFESQIQSLSAKESSYISQISTLNAKIAELNGKILELNKRTFALSASSLKKKVDNAVYQESADLRQQIVHLTEETKRLELDRWTTEKKLNSALTTVRSKLADRDHLVASLNSQIEKYQSVLTKLEKKLQTAQRQVVIRESGNAKKGETKVAAESKETQTTAKVRDRTIERPRVRFEDETTIHTEQRTVVVQRHQTQSDLEKATSEQREETATLNSQTARLIEELQSMLQASLQREKMATIYREISAVGEDILTSTTSHVVPSTTTKRATTSRAEEGGQSSQANSFLSFTDVYEQLIDMQFERLVSENAALKIKLKMAELATTTAPTIAVQ